MKRFTNFLLVTIALIISFSAFAQSGRKQKKEDLPPVQGVPAPGKTEEPPKSDIPEDDEKAKEKQKKLAPKFGIILGTFWGDMNSSMGTADYVRNACRAEMVKLIRGLEVRENNQMSRSDAVKMAKEEETFYAVALEFESFGGRPEVRYTIFEPKTGKITGTGSAPIYADPSGSYSYYSYQRAARDLAHQILGRIDKI